MDTSSMACTNEQPDVRVHKRDRHSDICSVREDEIRAISKNLQECEYIIPSPAIETTDVIFQFVNDLAQ